jgi:two-component system, NarL family, invasion response regulator UvrY
VIKQEAALKILIVDDHPVIISGCRAMLAGDDDIIIFEAHDGNQGYSSFFEHRPDVAVIDINLPAVSGFEITRRILVRDPDARIIIFSMNDDPIFAARSIEIGARGYITKNDDPALFVEAIRKVAAGGVFLSPEMAQNLAFHNVRGGGNPLSELSPREMEILRLLRNGNSLAEIASHINLSYKTIANTSSMLKAKLGAKSLMDLVRIAVEHDIA